MAAFAVPRYLAETARRDDGVSGWIAGLPAIVAGLAGRWSLRVGEPFQPGGQCSWTAPVTDRSGAGLVLKVGFRFPGGEERDEAAGLRLWDGNGAVRLHAACESESAYALLIERCVPGTPLGQVLPEPEQDQVVARLLGQLWAQPPAAGPFRPLAEMCAAWAEEFEREYAWAVVVVLDMTSCAACRLTGRRQMCLPGPVLVMVIAAVNPVPQLLLTVYATAPDADWACAAGWASTATAEPATAAAVTALQQRRRERSNLANKTGLTWCLLP